MPKQREADMRANAAQMLFGAAIAAALLLLPFL
jgi:hypothetical protein